MLYVDRLRTAVYEVIKVVNDIGLSFLKKYFAIKDIAFMKAGRLCCLSY